ncbi:hypothetical protein KAS41_04075 [Candidatus Parcubacteria bacterium]|nr:hypothetical protein [Candidatus Parcubacteria bacterium]
MPINLLPNNLKDREKSELKKAKKSRKDDIQMHAPLNSDKKNAKKNQKKTARRVFSNFSFFSKKRNKDDKSDEEKNRVFFGKPASEELKKIKSPENIKKLKVEPIISNTKEKIQTFQDYKKNKTEERRKIAKNHNKQIKNKIKQEDELMSIDKKKLIRNNSDVNFISGDLIGSIKIKIREKFFVMFFSLVMSAIILFSVYILIAWYQSSIIDKINSIKKRINETQSKISVYEERKDEIIKIQTKFKAINYLLENHIYCTNFLDTLEKYTLTNVYYETLDADINGNVSISALTDSFASVAKQLIVFQQAEEFVEFVEINSASFNDSSDGNELSVSFNINLKVKKDIFLK